MPDGDCSSKPKTSPRAIGVSPGNGKGHAGAPKSNEELTTIVRRLQSELDKIKHIEHRRRAYATAVKEREEAEAEARKEYFSIHWKSTPSSEG